MIDEQIIPISELALEVWFFKYPLRNYYV